MAKRNVEEATFNCPLCEHEVKDSEHVCDYCGLRFPNYEDFAPVLKFATENHAKLFEKADAWEHGYCAEDASSLYEVGQRESQGHDYSYKRATGKVYERRHWTDEGDLIVSREREMERVSGHNDANWEQVYSCYWDAAEGGHDDAMRELGKLVCYGNGTDLDIEQGFVLICKAAAMGNAIARNWLLVGDGGLSDKENWLKAKHAHEMLSYAGDVLGLRWAKYYLGNLYFYGANGIKKDYERAQLYYSAAAMPTYEVDRSNYQFRGNDFDGGFDLAKQMRSVCYFDGIGGVKQDVDLAIEYLNQISWNDKVYGARVSRCALKLLRRLDLWTCDELSDSLIGKDSVRILEGLNNSSYWDLDQFKALVVEAAKQYKLKRACDWISIVGEDTLASKAIGKFSAENKGLDGWVFVGRRPDKGILLGTQYHLFDIRTREGQAGVTGVSFMCFPFFARGNDLFYRTDCKNVMNVSAEGIGISAHEIAEFLNYVRRYVLLDRKEGVELLDGTLQKAKQNQSPEDQSLFFGVVTKEAVSGNNMESFMKGNAIVYGPTEANSMHLTLNPSAATPMQWGKMMSDEGRRSSLIDSFPCKRFSAEDWVGFIESYEGDEFGDLIEKVDWEGVNGLPIEKKLKVALKNRDFGGRIVFEKSEGADEIVKTLSSDKIARLLNYSPSSTTLFDVDSIDWSGLTAAGWIDVLQVKPEFADKCNVEDIDWNGASYKALYLCPEEVVNHFKDWSSISHAQWVEVVENRPSMKNYMKKYDKGNKEIEGDAGDRDAKGGCQLGCLGKLIKLVIWCAVIWYGLSVGVSFVDCPKFEVPEKARVVLNRMSNDGMRVREWVLGLIVKAQETKEDKTEK